jgi:hypothetical protein
MNRVLVLASLGVLAACATPASFTGRSEAELTSSLGPPSGEYRNPDGSRTLAYSTGRQGTDAYIAEVTASGQVGVVRSVRNDDTFQRIVPGMRSDAVLRMIGPPNDTMRFPRTNQESWEYQYVDTWGYRAFLYVNLDPNGIVVSKLTRRIDGRDGGMR